MSTDRLNKYTCKTCGGSIVTIDRDDGVTPFLMGCRASEICSGDMVSSFYRDVTGEPAYEWRKPTPAEYKQMSAAMRDHIDQGGLQIYRIVKP